MAVPKTQPEYSLQQAHNEIKNALLIATVAHPSQQYGFFLRTLTDASLYILCSIKEGSEDVVMLAFDTTRRVGKMLHGGKFKANEEALKAGTVRLMRDCHGELFRRLELCSYEPASDPFADGKATVTLTETGEVAEGNIRAILDSLRGEESTPSEVTDGAQSEEREAA